MHNGIALSLLDFLLVTAMLLLTPNDEWMNVTRASPSKLVPDSGSPYDSSFSHEPPDMKSLLTSESSPSIERWRSTKSPRVVEDNRSDCGESSDGRRSLSRATSRSSFHTETQSTAQHSTYPTGQGVFATRSDSSLSLALTFPRSGRGRTRELPVPPVPHPQPSFGRGPPSASSYASHVSHLPPSQDQSPPVPFLPGSSSTSSPSHDVHSPVINPSSIFSRHVAESPTSTIHLRSLPIPPVPSASKPRLPLLPPISPADSASISPISTLPSPSPRRRSLPRTHSHSHLRSATVSYPDSPHDFKPQVKEPPNYSAGAPNPPPLPISAHTSVQRGAMSLSLSIRTTDVAPMLRSASASAVSPDTSFASEPDPFDMPPAYSVLDLARSSSQLQLVSGELGQ